MAGTSLSKQRLRDLYVRYRVVVFAAGFLLASVVSFILATQISGDGIHQRLMQILTECGADPLQASEDLRRLAEGDWIQAVIYNLSATFVSLAAVLLVWEIASRHAWLDFVKESLLEVMTKPSFDFRTSQWREETLNRILIAQYGEELGDTVFREVETTSLGQSRMKRDFIYNIVLSRIDGEPRFHRAHFYLRFTVPRLQSQPVLTFISTSDSSALHAQYERMVRKGEEQVVYRYLLLTEHQVDPMRDFKVSRASISPAIGHKGPTLQLLPVPESTKKSLRIKLCPDDMSGKDFDRLSEGPCTLELAIDSIVDATKNEFPIFLGYPVKTFRSRLDASDVGAASVDIFEFLTSPERFRRDPSAVHGCAAGELEDVILPDSGLVYVWRTS